MKGTIIFLIFCFNFLTHSSGQIKLGLKAGFNFSKVKNRSHDDFTNKTNFNTGLVTNFKLDKKFILDLEGLFSAKGFNSILIPSGTIATNLYYLTLPVLLEYKATNKFYFQLGPELNLLVGAKMKNSTTNISVSDNYNNFDITVAGGLGYNILKSINLETRYSYGLSQIRKTPEIFGAQYNRTFQLNLIYFFR
jgi:outer membrane immunogenic protein